MAGERVTTVYTDGACSGNPGPGGWAWAVLGSGWAAGPDPATTNQRMEIRAALEAVQSLGGPLEVVSDSTYVVHCFRDRWFDGWRRRGWKNAKKDPVANRDLWEPLIELVEARGDVTFRWVKGHSGDEGNDLVDALAVRAAVNQEAAAGDEPPDPAGLVPDDLPRGRGAGQRSDAAGGSASSTGAAAAPGAAATSGRGPHRTDQQYRPDAHSIVVLGHKPTELGGYEENDISGRVRRKLLAALDAKRTQWGDVRVLTGLRLGAETLGAEAARLGGIPYVVVLPFPEADAPWPAASRARFRELVADADHVVTLEQRVPDTPSKVAGALRRRDAWLAQVADEAVLVWNGRDERLASLHATLDARLDGEVWTIDPGT